MALCKQAKCMFAIKVCIHHCNRLYIILPHKHLIPKPKYSRFKMYIIESVHMRLACVFDL